MFADLNFCASLPRMAVVSEPKCGRRPQTAAVRQLRPQLPHPFCASAPLRLVNLEGKNSTHVFGSKPRPAHEPSIDDEHGNRHPTLTTINIASMAPDMVLNFSLDQVIQQANPAIHIEATCGQSPTQHANLSSEFSYRITWSTSSCIHIDPSILMVSLSANHTSAGLARLSPYS